jgi:membrane-bound metal-dependent hydrolase YbcI (DUF457 family)
LDNITHTLVGLTLVRAGLGRRTPGALPAMIIASNAPDLDILSAITGGAVPYLEAHRGPTHGVLGVLLLALTTAITVALVQRIGSSMMSPEQRGSLKSLTLIALAGTVLHVLMDLPTSYGTRILSPFSDTWFAFDWLPIVDLYLWGLLIAGIVATSRWPHARAAIARTVLVLAMIFYGGRGFAHQRALDRAATMRADGVAERCETAPELTRHPAPFEGMALQPGRCLQAAALPTFLSPLRWQLIRQYPEGYELRQLSLAGLTETDRLWVANDADPWIAAAERTKTAQVFLKFSRMPARRSIVLPNGAHQVRLIDVRFVGGPFQFRRDPEMRPPFVATIVVAPSGKPLAERLGQ